MTDQPVVRLPRTLGLLALIAYGVGDILGAGIYSVVGKVAAHAGGATWLSFVCALFAAAMTALSYAELGSRFPRSGGEAFFCQLAFRRTSVSLIVGWLVFCSGVVSMATASHAFRGYFSSLRPDWFQAFEGLLPVAFLIILAGLNFWGMRQSSTANLVCTLVEVSGLVIVAILGMWLLARQGTAGAAPVVEMPWSVEGARDAGDAAASPTLGPPAWWGVLQGGAIALFAFIGFEDMVNVSEEVRRPKRNLPLAIVTALVFAGGLYLVVVILATSIVPPAELAASDAPLLEVVRRASPSFPAWVFSWIATIAVANTGLLNFIMGSRLLYGMSQQRLVPAGLGRLHPATRTPHRAILIILVLGVVLAIVGDLEQLAGATSFALLAVFAVVNLALLVIRFRESPRRRKLRTGFRCPWATPVLGIVSTGLLMVFVPPRSLAMVAGLLLLGAALIGTQRWLAQRANAPMEHTDGKRA